MPETPADLELRRSRRFLRRLRDNPFAAVVVDAHTGECETYYSPGMTQAQIDALRKMLDDLSTEQE